MFFNDPKNSFKSRRRRAMDEMQELKELRDKTEFEKYDFLALLIAGLITLLPAVGIVLLAYYFVSMFFFG